MELLLLAAGIGLIAYAFYKWATLNNDYFTVNYPTLPIAAPTFLIGSSGGMMMGLHHMDTWCRWLYNIHPKARAIGMFAFRQPMILLRDPELIKQVVVKDFDHFENHKLFIDPTVDELFGNSLFLMRGERWRDMRATLSPAFTGSKMRLMFDMVSVCAADMVKVLSERTVSTEGGVMRAPVKELFGRYTTDVIATAAFGIKVNSFVDEKNEFFEHGRRMMNFANFKAAAKLVIISASPKLARYFKIELMDREASQFFRSMALDTMRTRLEQGIYRPDMINLLMELKAGGSNAAALNHDQIDNKKEDRSTTASDKAIVDGFATVEESHIGRGTVQREWSDTELAAQCFLFFAAGFDTTSTVLSFLCYELAVNQDVQNTLFEECKAVQDGLPSGTPLSYDQLQRMQYMDQVVSESLRMWPPVLLTDRECTKDYIYEDAELRFGVLAGEVVMIPVFAMHRDEHFFAEPDRFQPERFGEERKSEIVQGSYLPFGVGPRNCIGSRFALMEVKAIIYHILLQFSVEPTHETTIPMRLAKAPGAMKPEKEIILALRRRQA